MLVGYLPVGFPDLATSIDAAVALVDSGVDVLELGLPYSDPVMDGQVIQAATTEALAKGFSVSQVFDVVQGITSRTDAAVLVMTYWNPVVRMGVDEHQPPAGRHRMVAHPTNASRMVVSGA